MLREMIIDYLSFIIYNEKYLGGVILENSELMINNNIIEFFKICLISIFTFYANFRILNIKTVSKRKIVEACAFILFVDIFCLFIKNRTSSISSIICMDVLIAAIFSNIEKNTLGNSILISTLSISFNYICYSVSIIICFIISKFLYIENDYIIMIIIAIIYGILIKLLFSIKKFKKGISFLKRNKSDEYFDILILNISATLFISFIILINFDLEMKRTLFVYIIIFSIIMFITIQKSLQLYYKQKLLIQDLNETKEELQKKNKEIEQLEKENLNFSKTSHSIAHKQKSLEYKLNQLMLKNETASEINIKERIDSISKQIYNETTEIGLVKTNIIEIDDMLKYMQSECIKHKIDFQVQLSGNIYQMINNHISKEKLEILIADHIKNAIIAINYSENTNKSILVRLGMINGFYSLYVYDSGIEFEIDTLLNLGKRPSTTHADNGGTGMGFMNTFDTLRKYKASMIIAEYNKPCKDNYTKVIKIKFDKKNEFKVCSYRSEEIKNKDIENNLIVEKLS